jgi:hypothetical protein
MSKRPPSFVLAAALLYLSAGAAASFAKEAGADPHAARPVPAPTSSRKIDEYGNIRWSDEKARLDNVAALLQSEPELQCYMICYGGRVSREGEAKWRCQRAAGYIVKVRGISPERVVTLDGGFREELTVELYPFLPGTTRPTGTPTVDPSEAKIIKAGPRRRPRRSRR